MVRAERNKAGLTLLDLSHRTGLSVSYLSDVERGQRLPLRARHIEKLAAALGIGIEGLNLAAGESRGVYILPMEGRSEAALEMGEAVVRLWTRLGMAGTALDGLARSVMEVIEGSEAAEEQSASDLERENEIMAAEKAQYWASKEIEKAEGAIDCSEEQGDLDK